MLVPILRMTAAISVLAAATACSGAAAPAAPQAGVATGADRAAIERVFGDYDNALLARDFAKACSLTAPQAVTALVKSMAVEGGKVASCEQAFSAMYAIPEASKVLDADARSAKIDNVAVAGDAAMVTYSNETNGQPQKGLTNRMQRINGQWRLLGNE